MVEAARPGSTRVAVIEAAAVSAAEHAHSHSPTPNQTPSERERIGIAGGGWSAFRA